MGNVLAEARPGAKSKIGLHPPKQLILGTDKVLTDKGLSTLTKKS